MPPNLEAAFRILKEEVYVEISKIYISLQLVNLPYSDYVSISIIRTTKDFTSHRSEI